MSGGNGVEDSDESVGQTPVSKGSGRTPEDAGTERRKPEKIPGLRARQTSLRRVKNSTDILRERSVRRQQVKIESVPDGNSASRDVKATKFTVANVGNNGKIYLRPSLEPHPQQVPQVTTVSPSPIKAAAFVSRIPELPQNILHTRDSVWTLLSTPIHAPTQPSTPPSDYFELRTRPKRSLSQSTIETQLANERLDSGAFKIVIDRPDSAPKDDTSQPHFPVIEVSIPHYRIGTPRFSARGTAFFHNSVYTRSSVHVDGGSSVLTPAEYERIFPKPPGIEAHAVVSRRHSHAAQPYAYSIISNGGGRSMAPALATHLYEPREPITPAVFERLALSPNDPSIVKFSPINRDIIAASPARIIAQITSEKFLDYELLSDFFLTVRSWLSTHSLLSYLLARFEWAINRFDDNGRIIRVRAFAALRHWILNYFSYDFVTDRELRVLFCERLNALTKLIKSRDHSASDLKLIADLKKCWNGRCLVYWDGPASAADGQQDVDIQPGGILGSRDSELVHHSQLRSTTSLPAALSVNPAQVTACATSISTWYSVVMDTRELQAQAHNRQSAAGTLQSLPRSPSSEQSNPVLSCSIPAKQLKRVLPYANKAPGTQPVPHNTDGRRVCPAAPSSTAYEPARPVAVHRRSGSFSDAARDKRAPLSSEVPTSSEAIAQELYQGNSMLRGQVVPPGPPFVTVAPTTPISELPRLLPMAESSVNGGEGPCNRKLVVHNSAPTKGIIGNIRRALSGKHAGVSPATQDVAPVPFSPLTAGKSATLPLNIMYQASSNGHMEAFRSQSRVDLLAASTYDAFQKATAPPLEEPDNADIVLGDEAPQPSQSSEWQSSAIAESSRHLLPEPLRPDLSRLTSGVTDSSQSILIMDDTGLNIPNLTGFRIPRAPETASTSRENLRATPVAFLPGSASAQHTEGDEGRGARDMSHQSNKFMGSRSLINPMEHDARPVSSAGIMPRSRPSAVTRNMSTGSASLSLRRCASFQSTFGKHVAGNSINTDAPSDSSKRMTKETPERMLRRRPGGDLRANQNVHDMEGPRRPKSAGSIATYSESMRGSQMLGFGEKITRTFIARKSPDEVLYDLAGPQVGGRREDMPSYVRTHSSQHALKRPSFQACVAEFARIPDDDEGGVAATLLKLEGKYISPVHSPAPPASSQSSKERSPAAPQPEEQVRVTELATDSSSSASAAHLEDEEILLRGQVLQEDEPAVNSQAVPRETVISTVYSESEDSYNPIPILARVGGEDTSPSLDKGKDKCSNKDGEMRIDIPNGERRLKRGSIAPSATTDSFLLDENDEFLSDVETEASAETIDGNSKTNRWLNGTNRPMSEPKENAVLLGQQHPPSPPMTMENALSIHSQARQAHDQRKPPTPDPSPVSQHVEPNILASKPTDALELKHMPFILGCDSELLAQQFTILEKEALKEIDWRDLVDLRWHNTTAAPTNWVDYLMAHDPLGIDLVTARFNIMVKWALSEIVLTDNLEERALCIMKYIHIAQQARKIHNYATLFQITIALTSTDCTRLSKTWDAVPTAEKEILQDLEMLVSPRRNFHNLRSEMEKANADEGCIPVVALYIHDLTYNSSKPSQLPAVDGGDPLINFERHRRTATIVKNLLRLIDAASKYQYKPVEGVIDRCLWMACLPDQIIMQKSKSLTLNV